MYKTRICGCKGLRTCLICERQFDFPEKTSGVSKGQDCYVYCPCCNTAWEGWDWNIYKNHPNHNGKSLNIGGVFIKENFLTDSEELQIIENSDKMEWSLSQSGRRKQNFGPKTNFKKRKIACGLFNGFPFYTKFIQDRFEEVPVLKDYQSIEQCFLEYDPSRGASIDPHIDDCWIWGERIITVNCLSDSVLTMTPYFGDSDKYNLKYANLSNLNTREKSVSKLNLEKIIVRIPMPRKSLLVLYGESRYQWEHFILREDIVNRRVCIAYREFTPPYLPGGIEEDIGKKIITKAQKFWENPTNDNVLL